MNAHFVLADIDISCVKPNSDKNHMKMTSSEYSYITRVKMKLCNHVKHNICTVCFSLQIVYGIVQNRVSY